MFTVLVNAPANAHFFEALDGHPVASVRGTLWREDDLLELVGDLGVLFAQFFTSRKHGAYGAALFFRCKVVHVASAAGKAERFALVALHVEVPADHGLLAATADILLLEANIARFRAAHGELAQRTQVALVRRRTRRTHRSALDARVGCTICNLYYYYYYNAQ